MGIQDEWQAKFAARKESTTTTPTTVTTTSSSEPTQGSEGFQDYWQDRFAQKQEPQPLSREQLFSEAARERYGITQEGYSTRITGRQGSTAAITPAGTIYAPVGARIDSMASQQVIQQRNRIEARQAAIPTETTSFVGVASTRTPMGTQQVAVPMAGVESMKVTQPITTEQKFNIVRMSMPRQTLEVGPYVSKSSRSSSVGIADSIIHSDKEVEEKKRFGFSLKKTLFKEKEPIEDFYKDVEDFSKMEKGYYESPYFKTTEKISAVMTFGYSKEGRIKTPEERSFMGNLAQEFVKVPLNIPGGLFGLATLTPEKAALTGRGLGYKETRVSTLKELGWGTPLRTLSVYDVRTPSGFANVGAGVLAGVIKGRADMKAKGSTKIRTKSHTHKTPVTEELQVKTVGKKGSIKTVEIEPTIEWTVQGKRVKPESYAKILVKEGKISYSTGTTSDFSGSIRGLRSKQPKITVAKFERDYILKVGLDPIETYRAIPENIFQQATAHELIHYKTPKISSIGLPGYEKGGLAYKLSPGEVLAWNLEKPFAKRGFKVSSQRVESYLSSGRRNLFLKSEGPTSFQYPRQQLLQKVVGKNAPAVTASEGTIVRGGRPYKTTSVQVGRKVYGSIRGDKVDIVYQKSPKGGINVKYLRKENIQPRYMREFKSMLRGKASTLDIDVEPSLVKKTRRVPYEPETISLQKTSRISGRKIDQLDVGKRLPGGEEVFPRRATARERVVNVFGESDQFVKGRDIQKGFIGKAKSRLKQTDVAGPQKEVVTIGGRKIISFKEPDVKYAYQPKYKPATKAYKMDYEAAGPIPVTEYVDPPSLLTKRKTDFTSGSEYVFEQSRYKPVKRVVKSIGKMGKKGQVSLTRGKVTVQAPKPTVKTYISSTQPPLTGREVLSIFKEPSGRVIPIVPITRTEPVSKSIYTPISRQEPKLTPSVLLSRRTTAKPQYRIKSKGYIKSKPETRIQPKVEVRPMVQIRPKVEVRPKTRTKAKTATKTVTRTVTKTQTPIQQVPQPVPPPVPIPAKVIPPPLLFPSFPGGKSKSKRKSKKYSLTGEYKPQIRAVYGNIKGPRAEILTGIGFERPITKKKKKKIKMMVKL